MRAFFSILLLYVSIYAGLAFNAVAIRRSALYRFKGPFKQTQVLRVQNARFDGDWEIDTKDGVKDKSHKLSDYMFKIAKKIMKLDIIDLDEVINENYNAYSKTLDLSGKVSQSDLFSVLRAIQSWSFYKDIEDLKLDDNKFVFCFTESNHAFIQMLPPNLVRLDLSNNQLFGSDIPWNAFPRTLQYLYLQNNSLDDTIEWNLLPPELKVFSVRNNNFEGEIKWDELPKDLKMIVVTKQIADSSMASKPNTWNRHQNSFFYDDNVQMAS